VTNQWSHNESDNCLPISQHLFCESSCRSSHAPFHIWEKSMMRISWISIKRNDPMRPIIIHAAETSTTINWQLTAQCVVCIWVTHKMLAAICNTNLFPQRRDAYTRILPLHFAGPLASSAVISSFFISWRTSSIHLFFYLPLLRCPYTTVLIISVSSIQAKSSFPCLAMM